MNEEKIKIIVQEMENDLRIVEDAINAFRGLKTKENEAQFESMKVILNKYLPQLKSILNNE